MEELRFGVFGAGFWAPYQLAAWGELDGARAVAIYNRTLSKAESLAKRFGIPAVYGSAEKLLDSEALDFIDIITGPSSHPALVRMAAERAIPVICQKPMAPTLAVAEDMVNVCREHRVPFYVHENWRWQPQIREFKRVLESGDIGTPFRASIYLVSGYPVFKNEPSLKEAEQFILADMGVHLLDITRFLFGEPVELYCHTHRVQADIKGEDAATIMMRMKGEATVTVHMGFPGHFLEHDVFTQTLIFVEGDRGSAELARDYWIRVTTESGTHARRHAPVWRPWMHPQYIASHASLVPCNASFLRAFRGGGEAETTGEDNLKTLRLTFAAYDSARARKLVQLSGATEREPVSERA